MLFRSRVLLETPEARTVLTMDRRVLLEILEARRVPMMDWRVSLEAPRAQVAIAVVNLLPHQQIPALMQLLLVAMTQQKLSLITRWRVWESVIMKRCFFFLLL